MEAAQKVSDHARHLLTSAVIVRRAVLLRRHCLQDSLLWLCTYPFSHLLQLHIQLCVPKNATVEAREENERTF